jgi:hypothetical protein
MRRGSVRWWLIVSCAAVVVLLYFGLVKQWSQNHRVRIMQVDVPFAFHVGNRVLSAGEYVIEPMGPLVFRIRPPASAPEIWITTRPVVSESESQSRGSLVAFNSIKSQYFLSELWWEGVTVGRAIISTPGGDGEQKTITLRAEVHGELSSP